MKIRVKKLHPEAIIPKYATPGAACFDLHAIGCENKSWNMRDGGWSAEFQKGDAIIFETGLSFEIPPGHVMLIYSRSGHGFKHGARLSNCVGVIDSRI